MNHFRPDLEWSQNLSDEPFWLSVYRRAFPSLVGCHDLRADGEHQRAGIDRLLVLANSKTLYVDEKGRREDWPDILLETFHEYPSGHRKDGWARLPLRCDYVAYALVPSQTCYLLPFLLMQSALRRNWDSWNSQAKKRTNGFSYVVSDNPGYRTRSLAVPPTVLLGAIGDAITVTWTTAEVAA
jgi:hypothetical protein